MSKPALRRGFKTEAEEYAKEFREGLDLEEDAPLCPRRLAEHLAIPLFPLSFLRNTLPKEVICLKERERSTVTGTTLVDKPRPAGASLVDKPDFSAPRFEAPSMAVQVFFNPPEDTLRPDEGPLRSG
jgi:hypothetical protein